MNLKSALGIVLLTILFSQSLEAQNGRWRFFNYHKSHQNHNHFKNMDNLISNNEMPVGLEYNLLFSADERYTVTVTGNTTLEPAALFDGILLPTYETQTTPTPNAPVTILIEGLPSINTRGNAWIGWTTRNARPKKFKIEGFDARNNVNDWVVISDFQSETYDEKSFVEEVPKGKFTKLRFTIYKSAGQNGKLGIAELFFIHPEATAPYQGLAGGPSSGGEGGIFTPVPEAGSAFFDGKIGIGTENPDAELTVAGEIHSRRVRVDTEAGADFVFEPDYNLPNLEELEYFVKTKRHLPGIQSEAEMIEQGVDLKELSIRLLQKVEELTLYTIEQDKRLQSLEKELSKKK